MAWVELVVNNTMAELHSFFVPGRIGWSFSSMTMHTSCIKRICSSSYPCSTDKSTSSVTEDVDVVAGVVVLVVLTEGAIVRGGVGGWVCIYCVAKNNRPRNSGRPPERDERIRAREK